MDYHGMNFLGKTNKNVQCNIKKNTQKELLAWNSRWLHSSLEKLPLLFFLWIQKGMFKFLNNI